MRSNLCSEVGLEAARRHVKPPGPHAGAVLYTIRRCLQHAPRRQCDNCTAAVDVLATSGRLQRPSLHSRAQRSHVRTHARQSQFVRFMLGLGPQVPLWSPRRKSSRGPANYGPGCKAHPLLGRKRASKSEASYSPGAKLPSPTATTQNPQIHAALCQNEGAGCLPR